MQRRPRLRMRSALIGTSFPGCGSLGRHPPPIYATAARAAANARASLSNHSFYGRASMTWLRPPGGGPRWALPPRCLVAALLLLAALALPAAAFPTLLWSENALEQRQTSGYMSPILLNGALLTCDRAGGGRHG